MTAETLPELIASLARTPNTIAAQVAELPDAAARWRDAPDEFSVVESVCHLRDIEIEGYSRRIYRILNEEQPLLADIDGSRLAVERAYNSQSIGEALAAFTAARNGNVRVLAQLQPEHFSRLGMFAGTGSINLEKLIMMMQEHDASHIADIFSLCRSTAESGL